MPAMPNPAEALSQRKRALCARKSRLKADYEQAVREIDDEIREIDGALKIMAAAVKPYLCPDCGGSGNRRVPDAAGQMGDTPCRACKGTGINPNANPDAALLGPDARSRSCQTGSGADPGADA